MKHIKVDNGFESYITHVNTDRAALDDLISKSNTWSEVIDTAYKVWVRSKQTTPEFKTFLKNYLSHNFKSPQKLN